MTRVTATVSISANKMQNTIIIRTSNDGVRFDFISSAGCLVARLLVVTNVQQTHNDRHFSFTTRSVCPFVGSTFYCLISLLLKHGICMYLCITLKECRQQSFVLLNRCYDITPLIVIFWHSVMD